MSYYDQFGRRIRRPQQPAAGPSPAGRGGDTPTLEDYMKLRDAFHALQSELEAAQKELSASQEALRQQTKKAIDLDVALQEARTENERLQEKLDAAEQQEQNEWQSRYLRLQAEMENLRKRLDQRSRQQAEESRLRILEDMLPLADHLEMALEHLAKTENDQPQPDEVGSFRTSLEGTRQAFLDSLARHGVRLMEPLGQPFDPEQHEAVGLMPSPETPEDHVAAVVRTGYEVDGRLLRPARVLVSSG